MKGSGSRHSFVSSLTGARMAVGELLPDSRYQRCMVHVMRGIRIRAGLQHTRRTADALRAVFAMESRESVLAKAGSAASEMGSSRKLRETARCSREDCKTTAHLLDGHPVEHRRRISTNNMIERPDHEIRHRTRVMGNFSDGRTAPMSVSVRIRYVTTNDWSTRQYLDVCLLHDTMNEAN